MTLEEERFQMDRHESHVVRMIYLLEHVYSYTGRRHSQPCISPSHHLLVPKFRLHVVPYAIWEDT